MILHQTSVVKKVYYVTGYSYSIVQAVNCDGFHYLIMMLSALLIFHVIFVLTLQLLNETYGTRCSKRAQAIIRD